MIVFTGCKEEELRETSVFDTSSPERSEFDTWLLNNYVKEYNIDFHYRYIDKEVNQSYNVVPAEFNKAKAMAILVKKAWLEVYEQAVSKDFMRTYSPRVIQLIGSYQWNSNNSQVLGTAEGGLKVYLLGVNDLDLDNLYVNFDDPYRSNSAKPMDMGYWIFHTMHHEFCHILTQTKEYQTDFQNISNGTYHATDWVNVTDAKAAPEGFVSGYASGEYNEDFAETYAQYVSHSEKGWNAIMEKAGEEGGAIIQKKLDMVRQYFQSAWNLDIDKLRDTYIERAKQIEKGEISLTQLP